jgi:hypothetical protein
MPGKLTRLAFVTAAPRIIIAAIYLGVSCYLICKIGGAPSVVVATRPLHTNDVLSRDDLQTSETAKLVGKYLQRDVAPGQPITSDTVGPQELASKIASASVAVIVRVSSTDLHNRGIQDGSPVAVTVKSDTVSGVVEKIDCNAAQQCAVFVSVTGKVPQAVDAQALATADIKSVLP